MQSRPAFESVWRLILVLPILSMATACFDVQKKTAGEQLEEETADSMESSKSEKWKRINTFKNPRPSALLCGKEGYRYLYTEYFRPNCGGCHAAATEGGFQFPYFSASDFDYAYFHSQISDKELMLKLSTQNIYCGEDCMLDVDGEKYKAIEEWIDHREGCPSPEIDELTR